MTASVHNHTTIDQRGLALARAIVMKLERTGAQPGVDRARAVNRRWREIGDSSLHEAWSLVLEQDWSVIRATLLDETQRGSELRQNNPFCGVLTNLERWHIIKEYSRHAS